MPTLVKWLRRHGDRGPCGSGVGQLAASQVDGRCNPRAQPIRGRLEKLMGGYVELEDSVYYQVGFGSEHGIDSIGSYWFYCNESNAFVQKCPLCTTDLSHVTDLCEDVSTTILRESAGDSSAVPVANPFSGREGGPGGR